MSSVIGIHEIDDGRFSQPRSRYNKRAARGFSQWIAIRIVIVFGGLILLFVLFQMQVPKNDIRQEENISSGNESSRTLDEPQLLPSLVQETQLQPLQPIDRDQYTIRIMTYRRNDQLLISLNHHSSCPGVALIQVCYHVMRISQKYLFCKYWFFYSSQILLLFFYCIPGCVV